MGRRTERHFSRGNTDIHQAHEKMLNIIKSLGKGKSKPQLDITSHLSE